MSKRDYYEVLGLQKNASIEDIKKAYKKIALRDHPDKNKDDPNAEARFKEATEAYTTLSNEDRRREYDQWGHNGPGFGGGNPMGGDPFSGFRDIFSDIFGRQGQRNDGPQRGGDIRISQGISLKESLTGCHKELTISLPINCTECSGSGAKKGTQKKHCTHCSGTGQVAMRQGFMSIFHPCQACGASGEIIESPCDKCNGTGQVNKSRKINMSIPAGIDHGQQLRVPGGGLQSRNGGPNGDAYVLIDIQPLENWRREGSDLVTMHSVSFPTAVMGGCANIELPNGEKVEIIIPPGVQPGSEIITQNVGVPNIKSPNIRGNLRVIVNIKVPQKISEAAKGLLTLLEKELI